MSLESDPRSFPSRREWLAGVLGAGLGGLATRSRADGPDDAEASVRKRAARAGLKDVGTSRSEHYQAIGDAPADFREQALALCESLATTYQKSFQEKSFPAKMPARKMTVVVLAGRASYTDFKGEPASDEEGGHYDVGADRLVIFDARGPGGPPMGPSGASQRRLNTFSLVHEAIHQLTFDTGLLDRRSDVPVAVSEGFATYGELWQQSKRVIGQVNRPRLQTLTARSATWLPVERLITDDALFSDENNVQVAYGEAWLLVYHLLKTKREAFRAYLETLRTRENESHRAEDAVKAFGSLDSLDRELKKAAKSRL